VIAWVLPADQEAHPHGQGDMYPCPKHRAGHGRTHAKALQTQVLVLVLFLALATLLALPTWLALLLLAPKGCPAVLQVFDHPFGEAGDLFDILPALKRTMFNDIPGTFPSDPGDFFQVFQTRFIEIDLGFGTITLVLLGPTGLLLCGLLGAVFRAFLLLLLSPASAAALFFSLRFLWFAHTRFPLFGCSPKKDSPPGVSAAVLQIHHPLA